MLDADKGRTLWEGQTPFDPWWSNLTSVTEDRAILEGYTSRDLPIPKGIAALDLLDGSLVWSDADAQLVEVRAHSLMSRRSVHGIERTQILRLADGSVSDEHDDAAIANVEVQYPVDVDRSATNGWLTPEEVAQLRGPIELLMRPNERILSYHLQNPRSASDLMRQTFRCELRVLREDPQHGATELVRETLAEHSPFPVAGNFLVLHDILIYVQEKTRLMGVHLT